MSAVLITDKYANDQLIKVFWVISRNVKSKI